MTDISTIKQVATRGLGRGLLVARKYSPEILTTVGIVSGVAAAVMAARATLKVEPIIDDIQTGRELVVEKHRQTNPDGEPLYSEHEKVRDTAYVYARGSIELIKLYGPSISLGIGSIASILGAHGIMRRRNVALVAAYKALEEGFSAYRKRVVEEFGEDKDREILYNFRDEEIENKETGKKEVVKTAQVPGYSPYARCFDELSLSWEPNPDYNIMFLNCQQKYANDKLHARGHVFLNEVYDMLGIPRTSAGQVVGWVLDGNGDGYIDFGIYDVDNEKAREFINGYEKAIILDFNVDGLIYDKI